MPKKEPMITVQMKVTSFLAPVSGTGIMSSQYRCIACGKSGDVIDSQPCGLPHGSRSENLIIHEAGCPVGAVLNEDGTFKT